ncbi:MAG: glycosyltransferase family 4 protein [Phycisphaerales bacterium]|nr:glycosyltransferase family 4 protein [Phycisphaerales bacterium]
MPPGPTKTLLVLSATFPPDAPAVGQHMADVGEAMAARGWRVVVVAADRAYDNPAIRFPAREIYRGMDVRRVPFASFGKRSILTRALGMAFYLVQAMAYALCVRNVGAMIVSTSPPLCGVVASIARLVRGVPFLYWMMDLNPDQIVALGKARPSSPLVRIFDAMQRFILRRAARVVVLDRFMADRLRRKHDPGDALLVIPPWAHDEPDQPLAHGDNPFRATLAPPDSFVVMYSGNHGYSTPVSAMLDAAALLAQGDATDRRALFVFVGGGVRKGEVDERLRTTNPPNVKSLPYQPLERLRESLSAADVHVVTMDAHVVGMVHPCKIYGAMAIARPILVVGPDECHATDILWGGSIGWHARDATPHAIAESVRAAMRTPAADLASMGLAAKRLADTKYARATSLGRLCDELESIAGAGQVAASEHPRATP